MFCAIDGGSLAEAARQELLRSTHLEVEIRSRRKGARVAAASFVRTKAELKALLDALETARSGESVRSSAADRNWIVYVRDQRRGEYATFRIVTDEGVVQIVPGSGAGVYAVPKFEGWAKQHGVW